MANKVPMLNALFACAMVEGVSLSVAAEKCRAAKDDLSEAVKYRCNVATGGPDGKAVWFSSYEESIYEAFKRLESAN